MRLILVFALAGLFCAASVDGVAQSRWSDAGAKIVAPDPAMAASLLSLDAEPVLLRQESPVPGWQASRGGEAAGFIASTWEVAGSVGYSGQPIEILIGVSQEGVLSGAALVRHAEPILTLGLSSADVASYIEKFRGYGLTVKRSGTVQESQRLPETISRATVTSGVIKDAILRTARTVASARLKTGGLDRVDFVQLGWADLTAQGALSHGRMSLDEAHEALTEAKVQPPKGTGAFIDAWIGIIDPPTIGQNLLGQMIYSNLVAEFGSERSLLLIAANGVHSHRGTLWRRTGQFDRLAVRQVDRSFRLLAQDYRRIDRLAMADAPAFKEISVFLLPEDFDSQAGFQVEIGAVRPTADGFAQAALSITHTVPEFYHAAMPDLAPHTALWRGAWEERRWSVVGVAAMLVVLAGVLFLQEAIVSRPRLWRYGRIAYLTTTLIWLGWLLGGQLSVVQVIAFLHALLSGFRWETFLIEPVIFLLWGFVALGLLFWGRGVFCGWLCPFGALQELTNNLAQRLGVPQVTLPFGLHERLWAIKYTLFLGILALSFYSMSYALMLAEAEPFKTAVSMRFAREWPFVAFVAVILCAGLFIERFYCRYLCPLGAALAIPAKLKLFDWLRRRPQCGRECRLCEQQCTVGAIDPLGRINPNECVLCLRCQMVFHDPQTCTVLKGRRNRAARAASGPST